MTALLIAKLVEQGKLTWSSKIKDIFPELSNQSLAEFNEITVEQLLSHSAGLAKDSPGIFESLENWPGYIKHIDTMNAHILENKNRPLTDQRLDVLADFGKKKLKHPKNEFHYSNVGYVILGAIIEKVTGLSYETAMTKLLFKPLGIDSAEFKLSDDSVPPTKLNGHYFTNQPRQKVMLLAL